jgi:FkbM family methyltransferase
MEENIALNSVKNVVPFPMAIGINSEEMTLVTTGEAVQHTTTNSETTDENASTIKVPGVSLHDAFQLIGIARCNLLKIDCEGCEFDILLNADKAILQRIDHISLEYHDGFTRFSHMDLVKHLKYNGFQIEMIPNPVHGYLGFMYAHR